MSDIFVWPAKKRIDITPMSTDFKGLLGTASIDKVTIVVTVFSGIDADPSSLLYLPYEVAGTIVTQRLKHGIVGVTYKVTFTVLDTDENVLVRSALLSILPDEVPPDAQYIPLYFTSTPYPYVLGDSISLVNAPTGGSMKPGVFYYKGPPESLSFTNAPTSGTLSSIVKYYAYGYPDAISMTSPPTEGALRSIVKNYDMPPTDFIALGNAPTGGALKIIVISYTIDPIDKIEVTNTPLSGILST